jgi:hypothetical protein
LSPAGEQGAAIGSGNFGSESDGGSHLHPERHLTPR